MVSTDGLMIQRYYRLCVNLLKIIGAFRRRTETYLDVISEFIGKVSGLIILDVGCGSGLFSKALSKGNFVVALDIDPKPLKAINKDVVAVNADAHNMPFRPGSFDMVLSLSLMEHLEDPLKHVKCLKKIIRYGGWLVLQLPNLQYFFEPHTMIPLLFLLPRKLQKLLFRKLEYAYVNMDLTIKHALNLLLREGFALRKTKKIYHFKIMSLVPWAPSYMFLLQKS